MALGGRIPRGEDDAVGLLHERTLGESRHLRRDTLHVSQAQDEKHEHMIYD